jgi:hypothetical protein
MVLNHISLRAHQCVFYTCGSHALPLPRNIHFVVLHDALRRRARDLYPFFYLLSSKLFASADSPIPHVLATPLCAAVSPRKPAGHVLFRQRRSVSTRSSQTPPIYFASPRALQCCGAAVASRATGGGVASPVSVLTRGSVRGAPFLTNSVLISTF